ncbi:hypothetical protein KKC45_03295 [Patescibacteria group bacterium]|nr:hypothetical protein [Patescibacteria group bacterium]
MNFEIVFPSFIITPEVLLSPWAGLGLLIFFTFSVYRVVTEGEGFDFSEIYSDYFFRKLIHLLSLFGVIQLYVFLSEVKKISTTEKIFIFFFYVSFLVWLSTQLIRGIFFN